MQLCGDCEQSATAELRNICFFGTVVSGSQPDLNLGFCKLHQLLYPLDLQHSCRAVSLFNLFDMVQERSNASIRLICAGTTLTVFHSMGDHPMSDVGDGQTYDTSLAVATTPTFLPNRTAYMQNISHERLQAMDERLQKQQRQLEEVQSSMSQHDARMQEGIHRLSEEIKAQPSAYSSQAVGWINVLELHGGREMSSTVNERALTKLTSVCKLKPPEMEMENLREQIHAFEKKETQWQEEKRNLKHMVSENLRDALVSCHYQPRATWVKEIEPD